MIDATLLPANGRFHLIFKDETVKPTKKHLRIAVADNPEGPFGPPGPPFTRAWVEGPTSLRLGEKYIVYFDCYRDKHYGAVQSGDLVHWEDVTDRLSLPAGVRHGTALAVPGGVLAPLLRTNLPPISATLDNGCEWLKCEADRFRRVWATRRKGATWRSRAWGLVC